MHRRSVALSAVALAFASMPPAGVGPIRADRLDGRVGRDREGRVGLAAAGSGYMSPAQLCARSTYLARRRQTRRRRRAA